MEFANIEDFLDDVMPELPGCTEFTAIDRLRWAAIEFCRKTSASQEAVEELDIEANETLIEIPSPSNQVLPYLVLWAKTPHTFLRRYSRNYLAGRNIDWAGGNGTQDWPSAYVQIDRATISLIPEPSQAHDGGLELQCAFIPSDDCTKLDRVLLDEHREAIACGALSKLLRMSNEAWFNPNGAFDNAAEFRQLISNARAAVKKDRTAADTRVQNVHFA